jgi:hypothetical protein
MSYEFRRAPHDFGTHDGGPGNNPPGTPTSGMCRGAVNNGRSLPMGLRGPGGGRPPNERQRWGDLKLPPSSPVRVSPLPGRGEQSTKTEPVALVFASLSGAAGCSWIDVRTWRKETYRCRTRGQGLTPLRHARLKTFRSANPLFVFPLKRDIVPSIA